MKKLITLVAAMIGFGAFAVDPVITGTGFETAAYTAGSELAVSNDDKNIEYALEGYDGLVWEQSKILGEDAMVKAYDQDSGSYTPSATYGTRHQAIGNNYLGLDIGDARLDRYMVNCKNNNEEQPQEISATGFYIDTLVKFTAAEEPSWSAMQDTDKLSITYIEHDADPTADPVDAGYTNFVVRAGFINKLDAITCSITPTEYKLSVPANFDKSAWHRLTVRAIKDIGYDQAPVAFVVYVDEEMLQYSSSTKISTDDVTFGPMGTRFYSDTVHALLPSLINSGDTRANVSKLGFSGTGSIDNIAFVQNVIPEFVTEETPVTLKWNAAGFASITIIPAGTGATPIVVEDLTAGELAFELPVGVTSFSVTASPAASYEALPWTAEGATVDGANFTAVTPGAVCTLNAMKPVFNVIIGGVETKFESLEAALGAVAEADGKVTLKLLDDSIGQGIIFNTGDIVIDLAGKTIQGGSADEFSLVIAENANVVITNSTPDAIGSVLMPSGDNASAAIMIAEGHLGQVDVYGGQFDMFAVYAETLTVMGGKFLDADYDPEEEDSAFYLAEKVPDDIYVSDAELIEDAYYFTVGVEPPAPKPFQVIIGDADSVDFETFELALAAANGADDAAKIVLGEAVVLADKADIIGNVTLDLNGFTVTPASTWERTRAGVTVSRDALFVVRRGGTLTVQDTSATANGAIDISGLSKSQIYSAIKLTETGDSATGDTAAVVIKSGKVIGTYYGICGNGGRHDTSIVIDGGLVKGTVENDNFGIYNPQNGTITLNGGIVEGASGIAIKSGTVTVIGGTAVVRATMTTTAPYAFNGNGVTCTGDALVIDSSNYPGGTPNVSIAGGTFEAAAGQPVASYAKSDDPKYATDTTARVESFIAGGSFNKPLSEELCKAGFIPLDNGDGTYGVKEGTYVARVNDQGYESFADAFAAANAAATPATLKLLAEIVTPSYNVVAKDMTLDLNGQKISCGPSNSRGVFVVNNGATLTVDDTSALKDGVIDGTANTYAAVALTNGDAKDNTKTAGVVVKAGTLQGRYYGIVGNGSVGRENTSIVIDGGVVKGTAENDCAGIYNPQGNSTIVVNGGTIEGAVGIYAKAGTITVNGGEVKAVGAFVETPTFNGDGFNPCGDAIVLDSAAGYAGAVSLELGDDATLASANGYAVREAVTKGANTTLGITDNGADVSGASKGGLKVSDEFADKLASGAATITGYTIAIDGVCGNDTLLAAIGKVADGGTITLLANVPNATGITIDSKKTFTVDFNGFTYTVNKPGAGSTGTATQAFQLLKGQTITFKNGKIEASADNLLPAEAPAKNIKRFFQSYANLTLENMTLDGTNLYLNPADNAVCEFANGTVALTGSTSIDAPANCIAVSVDNWKKAYPDGVAVTINTTGTIDGVKVWTEGEGDSMPAQLTLTAGNITALEVAGEAADFTVTKGEGATVTAPEGYEWDETTGELKKVEEPTGLELYIAGSTDADYNAETNWYIVKTAQDFVTLANDVAKDAPKYADKVIKMANDVDFAEAAAFAGIGTPAPADGAFADGVGAFTGTFDGQGFTVKNLTLVGNKYSGLFNFTSHATVKNLTIELAGLASGGTTEKFATGVFFGVAVDTTASNLTAKGADDFAITGTDHKSAGIVAKPVQSSFTACTNHLDIAGSSTIGGIAGFVTVATGFLDEFCSFTDCYNDGTLASTAAGDDGVGGVIGYLCSGGMGAYVDGCVNEGELSTGAGNGRIGQICGTLNAGNHNTLENVGVVSCSKTMAPYGFDNPGQGNVEKGFNLYVDGETLRDWYADDAIVAGGTYTLANNNAKPVVVLEAEESITFVKGNFTLDTDGITSAAGVEIDEAAGTVTVTGKVPGLTLMIADQEYNAETNPYVITGLADFLLFQTDLDSAAPKYADKAIMQTDDVDLDGIVWAGLGSFSGTYDGAGHLIDNVVLADGEYTGVFKTLNGGTIKNLTVELNGFSPATASKFGGAVIGDVTPGSTIQCVKATGEMNTKHNSAGIAVRAYNSNFIDCTNAVDITTTYTKVGGIAAYVVDSNNAASTFVRCVNEGNLTSTTTDGNSGAGGIIGYQGASGAAKTLEGCVNTGTITALNAGAFIGYNNTGNVTGLGGNVAAANTVPVAKKEANTTIAGFTYATIADDKATFVADSALVAGETVYTLYADAAPVIELAANESITFDKKLFSLNDKGIKAGEGAELEAPVEAGTLVTYSAKAASTGPTIDDGEGEGTQVMIADDKTITNVNSTVALVLPEGWEISKDGEIYQVVDDKEVVWGKFPAYYAATVGEDGKVAISLSEAANLIVQEATDVEEMADGETEIFAVGEEEVGLAVKNTYKGLYYGLATCATVDGNYADPATVVQVEEDGQLIRLEAAKGGDACFYKMWVSDIAPEAAE